MNRECFARLVHVFAVLVFFIEGTEGLKYLACYKETSATDRLLKGPTKEFKKTLTIDICMSFCKSKGMRYFGLQYSYECFCSNEKPPLKSAVDEDECDKKCEGNPRETCGGNFRISVYDSEEDFVNVRYIGCYKEKTIQARLMTGIQKNFPGTLTNQKCIDFCKEKHFSYAGTQYKSECFCSNERPHFKSSANEEECNLACDGNEEEICGGGWRLSVHDIYDRSIDHALSDFMGCYNMSYDERNFKPNRKDNIQHLLTPEYCVGLCYRQGYRYGGVIEGLCFCGNVLDTIIKANDRDCDQPCTGDKKFKCGGNLRISLYHTEISDQSEEGKLLGCFEDNGNLRTLSGLKIDFKETNTPRLCLNVCLQLGYKFSGVQYGVECFCGNRQPAADLEKPESECSLTCPGDRLKMCGGGWRLLVFTTGKNSAKPASVLLSARPTERTTTQGTTTTTTRRTTASETVRPASKPKPKPVATSKPTSRPNLGNMYTNQTKGPSVTSKPNKKPAKPIAQASQTTKKYPSQPTTTRRPQTQPTTLPPKNPWEYNSETQSWSGESGNKRPGNNQQQNQFQQGSSWQQGGTQFQSGGITNQQLYGSNVQQRPNTPPTDFQAAGSAERTTPKPTCVRSLTEVKGENVCKGQVLFYDDFSEGGKINKYKWTHEVIMPWSPDYEFVTYQKSSKNSFVRNRRLYIKPTLLDDDFVKRGLLELESCTGLLQSEECRRQGATFNIIPPIESARLTTKDTITFRYGVVQIRAKLPIGDWIVPEIWLEPKQKDYGTGAYTSGRVRIAMARGNPNLDYEGRDIGNRQLEVGILMGVDENIRARTIIRDKIDGWWRSFHNYTLIWSPDNLQFLVDGLHQESLVFPGRPLYQLAGFDEEIGETWRRGSLIAPFDKEFYLTLGLSVGGMRDFPDDCRSSGHTKPWRNMAVKAMASFWEDRDWWQRTWDNENSALQIESVTITAL